MMNSKDKKIKDNRSIIVAWCCVFVLAVALGWVILNPIIYFEELASFDVRQVDVLDMTAIKVGVGTPVVNLEVIYEPGADPYQPPVVFHLEKGEHTLYVYGREPDVLLESIEIVPVDVYWAGRTAAAILWTNTPSLTPISTVTPQSTYTPLPTYTPASGCTIYMELCVDGNCTCP